MWNPLKKLLSRRRPVPESDIELDDAHAAYWGCAGHEVKSEGAWVSGGLFAVWHFPPIVGRGVGVYTTIGVGEAMGVEFVCMAEGESEDPFDDPCARLLMETALFKSKERPTLSTFDVVPLGEDTLPGGPMTHAIYAPPGLFFNIEELEAATGHRMVLVVPITREELQLIPTASAEAFLKAMADEGIEPRVDRGRFVRHVAP